MKLQLKHVAAYLPYNVQVQYNSHITQGKTLTATLHSANKDEIETTYAKERNGISGDIISWKSNNNDVKELGVALILRPLDLTIPILINGRLMSPFGELTGFELKSYAKAKQKSETYADHTFAQWASYELMQKLMSFHYDVFDLLSQGLAVKTTKP